jgi:hypothetical protein
VEHYRDRSSGTITGTIRSLPDLCVSAVAWNSSVTSADFMRTQKEANRKLVTERMDGRVVANRKGGGENRKQPCCCPVGSSEVREARRVWVSNVYGVPGGRDCTGQVLRVLRNAL